MWLENDVTANICRLESPIEKWYFRYILKMHISLFMGLCCFPRAKGVGFGSECALIHQLVSNYIPLN